MKDRIKLTRKLRDGIDRSEQGSHNGMVATFPATKRGALKAARVYRETRRVDLLRWGNEGAGRLWLELGGRDVTDEVILAGAAYPGLPALLTELLSGSRG